MTKRKKQDADSLSPADVARMAFGKKFAEKYRYEFPDDPAEYVSPITDPEGYARKTAKRSTS